jgi:hypothetical protein
MPSLACSLVPIDDFQGTPMLIRSWIGPSDPRRGPPLTAMNFDIEVEGDLLYYIPMQSNFNIKSLSLVNIESPISSVFMCRCGMLNI